MLGDTMIEDHEITPFTSLRLGQLFEYEDDLCLRIADYQGARDLYVPLTSAQSGGVVPQIRGMREGEMVAALVDVLQPAVALMEAGGRGTTTTEVSTAVDLAVSEQEFFFLKVIDGLEGGSPEAVRWLNLQSFETRRHLPAGSRYMTKWQLNSRASGPGPR
jgi:hypothetical protein